MTLPLLVLAALCVVNAPRARSALPVDAGARGVALLGALIALIALLPFAAWADPLLDAVDVSGPTARIAAGLLLGVSGLLALATAPPGPEPGLPGRRAALVPVAFPTLLTPGLAALTISGSVDRGAPVVVAVVAVALATVPAVSFVSHRPAGSAQHRVFDGLGRFLAGLLAIAGVGLLMDGVFDI